MVDKKKCKMARDDYNRSSERISEIEGTIEDLEEKWNEASKKETNAGDLLSETMKDIESKKRAGKDVKKLEDAMYFYNAQVDKFEEEKDGFMRDIEFQQLYKEREMAKQDAASENIVWFCGAPENQ